MRTVVYVDGFNLYYGAVKGTPFKWLNILRLCQLLLPKNQIVQLKYFTAAVTGRAKDPGQPNRQRLYLRALQTSPGLEIIYGHFLEHAVMMPVASPAAGAPKYVSVIKTEEKGSDVNIAAHMINDGYQGRYQVAILVSNDSDLVEPVWLVRNELKLPVGVLNPFIHSPSYELRKFATFVKPIRKGVLSACQFPPTLTDSSGTFHKPPTW
jgi:uncharacterized LabA/DUF88 family protein